MVSVVQLVEHQVVILDVAGSSPVTHPAAQRWYLAPLTFFFDEALQRCCNARRHVLVEQRIYVHRGRSERWSRSHPK
jgi:hypothetical protein